MLSIVRTVTSGWRVAVSEENVPSVMDAHHSPMRVIPTEKGPIFIDAEDFMFALGLSAIWHLDGQGYPTARINGQNQHLHKLIATRCGLEGQVDHKNQNRADCRRQNLREATHSQNGANCGLRSDNSSGFKGVSQDCRAGTWQAYIRVNGKRKSLKYWRTPEDAARAYDRAALILFGEFACTNFPRSDYA